jgi:hypothetical protein
MHHLGLLPLKEVPPREDLNLAIPNNQLLQQSHLILARVQGFAGIYLPLLELIEDQLQAGQDLHEGGTLGRESRKHVVGEEDHVLQNRRLILLQDEVAPMDQLLQRLKHQAGLVSEGVVIEVEPVMQAHVSHIHDTWESLMSQFLSEVVLHI